MNLQLSKLQESMKRADLDGFYIESEKNRLYLTGFKSSAGILVVLKSSAYFFADFRYIEAAREKIRDCEVLPMDSGTGKKILGLLSGAKLVGFEDTATTVWAFERLKERYKAGDFRFVPAGGILNRLRMVKEEYEIEKIGIAQKINERALYRTLRVLKPGMTEKELAAELEYALKLEGGEALAFQTIAIAGKNTSRPHGEPGDIKIAPGDFVTMDFGCTYEGYCSDMTRTVAMGRATPKMQTVYKTVLCAMERAFAAIRAGETGERIDAAARNLIYGAGYEGKFGHSLGHSVGIDIHEEPVFAPGAGEKIPANTVISVEPGIYLEGEFGVRIEDLIVVKEDGFLNLNASSKELIVL